MDIEISFLRQSTFSENSFISLHEIASLAGNCPIIHNGNSNFFFFLESYNKQTVHHVSSLPS